MNPKVATDFTGIGVPEMALEALGVPYNSVFACENDKFARQSYLANFKLLTRQTAPSGQTGFKFYEDITQRNHAEVGKVDLYIAGFPCQAFSISGKRKGFDDVRGTLFFDMATFIKTNKPKVFMLENVKGLLSHDKPKNSKAPHGNTFNTIINLLAQTVNGQYAFPFYTDNLGYHVYYKVLNSKHFGVPQNRERIFIVGFRDDDHTFSFPKETPLQTRLKDILEDEVDEKFYLNNRKANFNAGKINYKTEQDIASCINKSSGALDISDNILVVNDRGKLRETKEAMCIDNNYWKGMDNHAQRSMVLEVTEPKLKQVGSLYPNNSDAGRIYDSNGIARSIKGEAGGLGGKTGLYAVAIPEASKNGYAIAEEGDAIDLKFADSKTRRGRVSKGVAHTVEGQMQQYTIIKKKYGKHQQDAVFDSKGISPTLQSSGDGHIGGASAGYLKYLVGSRIRRLTPLECFRLQDIPDKMYWNCKNAGLSDTQLYKQAGNAMTRSVMMALIEKVLPNFK